MESTYSYMIKGFKKFTASMVIIILKTPNVVFFFQRIVKLETIKIKGVTYAND